MGLEDQLIFFFSALGAFNGLFLSVYFALFAKNRTKATYFLSALLFVVSVRVAKSVFMTYYAEISSTFIQVGLSACLLIGPFLYLYVRASQKEDRSRKWNWLWHVLPVIIVMVIIGYFYPYKEHRYLWQRRYNGYLSWILFTQWFTYVIYSAILSKESFRKVFSKTEKASNLDVWLVNLVLGIGIIWLAYFTNNYTSYIVGALSFSFTFYLSVWLWIIKRGKATIFYEKPSKYSSKKIPDEESNQIKAKLSKLFEEKELYKDSELKLSDLAKELKVAPHYLSQYLNDNLGKSFTTFINEYRVNAAEEMLKGNNHITLEAIGNECGFNSNSSFYVSFKKFKGLTPAQFKKKLQ